MKTKQFVLSTNSPLREETEISLNEFLSGVQFRDVQYSAVSGINILHKPYVTGMALIQYEDESPKPADVVQIKQFPLGTGDSLEEPTSRELNDFLVLVDVRGIRYAAVAGRNELSNDFVTGLVLVVYKPFIVKQMKGGND